MSADAAKVPVASWTRVLTAQTRAQLIVLLRQPMFSVTGLLLPVILFAFVGLPQIHKTFADGRSVGAFMLASFAAYAVSNVMVFNFGIGVALARGQKLDLLQRATPLPPMITIVAQVICALVFGLVAVCILFAFARIAGGLELSLHDTATCIALLLAGAVPLIGFGLLIGYSAGPSAAPAVTNLVYLPMVFASGMFVPYSELPPFVQKVAPFLPTFHYAQLAWTTVGGNTESLGRAAVWLTGFTIVFFVLAARAYQREESRKFR